MMSVLQNLEPISKDPNILLYEELDEFTEVLFFMSGSYHVGYSINRKEHFPLRLGGCQCIGAYGVTFGKRAIFIYKTYEECRGFFIRKNKWLLIMD